MGVGSIHVRRRVRWTIFAVLTLGRPLARRPPAVRAFCTQEWVMSMSSPSTTTASDLDVLRTRLADHQRQRLRALLAHALERSPFHARRA